LPKIWNNLVLFSVLFSAPLTASVLNELRNALTGSSPFLAEFRQEMIDNGRTELVETGFFIYGSPSRMKWEYRDPESKIFVLNRGKISFYDPQENQLSVGDVEKQKSQWLWQVLTNDSEEVEIEENEVLRSIKIRQKEDETVFTVFVGDNGLPEHVTQQDSLGYEFRYTFSGYRLKCKIGDKDFEIKAPQDVEIVELE